MGDFKRGNRNRDDRTMHSATCSDCGNKCQVPFKPTGSKPVLCGDCFSKHKPARPRERRDDRSNRHDRDLGPRPMGAGRSEHYDLEFEKLNAKLDKILAKLTPVHTRSGIKSLEEAAETHPEEQE